MRAQAGAEASITETAAATHAHGPEARAEAGQRLKLGETSAGGTGSRQGRMGRDF